MLNSIFKKIKSTSSNDNLTFCKLNLAILNVERAIYDFFIFQTLIFKYLILLSDAKLEKKM